jgi:hypothetical protein
MKREKGIMIFCLTCLIFSHPFIKRPSIEKENDRAYWLSVLRKIADPVLEALSRGQLKSRMPVETLPGLEERKKVTHLEAFGRLMAGMAPWLEIGPEESKEGKIRQHYIELVVKSLANAVNPESADFMNFTEGSQPLVDAAFLGQALIRAPRQLWGNLDEGTRSRLIDSLRSTRAIKPSFNNWLLFSAMVETALLKFDGKWDSTRVDYALSQHEQWYKGDGVYGDGPEFHWDYYNSYVIQPMLIDITRTLKDAGKASEEQFQKVMTRAKRYAAIQERLISPEGTFPPLGRSLAYRFGAFQLLSQMALIHELPEDIQPAQVRCGLTAVIRRMAEAPGTFDENGWLRIGFCGHQPSIAEGYISTGSLYLCTVGLLALGLPESDIFWKSPPAEWTSKKIWSGKGVKADYALKN